MGFFSWLFRRRRRLTSAHRERFVSQFQAELRAQLDWGLISEDEYERATVALSDPITAQRVILKSQREVGAIDWPGIIAWLEANWSTILQVILAFAFLVLGPEDEEEASELWPDP